MEDAEVISKYEGITIHEAYLSYAERKNLSSSAFCGPNMTYPSHDAIQVKNSFEKLAEFGHRLPEPVRQKIYESLVSKAKRFGVEHDPTKYRWGKYIVHEVARDYDGILDWFVDEFEKEHK